MIIAFILLGRTLEEKAKGDTTASLKSLIGLQPKNAIVVAADGTQTEIPISRIRVGDLWPFDPGRSPWTVRFAKATPMSMKAC